MLLYTKAPGATAWFWELFNLLIKGDGMLWWCNDLTAFLYCYLRHEGFDERWSDSTTSKHLPVCFTSRGRRRIHLLGRRFLMKWHDWILAMQWTQRRASSLPPSTSATISASLHVRLQPRCSKLRVYCLCVNGINFGTYISSYTQTQFLF